MPLSLTIAGVDRTSRVEFVQLQVQEVLTSQIDTLTFPLRIPAGNLAEIPTAGQTVVLLEDTTKLFAGIVITNPRSFLGNAGEILVQVTAQDWQAQMARKLIASAYDNKTAGYIANDILSQLSAYSFLVGQIDTGPVLPKWSINYATASDALAALASSVGFDWYVDYDKKLYFVDTSGVTAPAAPWDLTEGASTPYTSSAPYAGLQYQEDVTQIRNIVTVRGAQTQSALSSQKIVSDGQARSWILNLGEVVPGSLTMNVGGAGVTVGEEGVIDPSLVAYLVNYKNRSVQATTGTSTIGSGTTIEFIYRYKAQIIVTARNEASIATYGEYEHVIVNSDITERSIALQVAQADLRVYGNPAITLRYTTSRPGLRAGMVQTVNIPRFGINTKFLIRSVTMRLITYAPNGVAYQSAGYIKNWDVELEKVS